MLSRQDNPNLYETVSECTIKELRTLVETTIKTEQEAFVRRLVGKFISLSPDERIQGLVLTPEELNYMEAYSLQYVLETACLSCETIKTYDDSGKALEETRMFYRQYNAPPLPRCSKPKFGQSFGGSLGGPPSF